MAERVIHKQKLPIFTSSDDLVILVPRGAHVLKIARQFPHEETPYCWYACDPAAPLAPLSIIVVGTGGEIPANALAGYLGTEIFHKGQLVFHFFRDPASRALDLADQVDPSPETKEIEMLRSQLTATQEALEIMIARSREVTADLVAERKSRAPKALEDKSDD